MVGDIKQPLRWRFAEVLAVVAGLAAYYFFPMLFMKPAETGPIPGTAVYAIKNNLGAVYSIHTDEGYILIDAGSSKNRLERSLLDAAIALDEVKWILLTHSDSDHVAALGLFPEAAIYMSEDEFALLDGSVRRNFLRGRNTMPPGFDSASIIPLEDGQELLCGGIPVQSIKAPGHTPGSMAYLVDGRYLFTGDAFEAKNGAMKIHPYTMDKAQGQETIERFLAYSHNNTLVFTAHYGYHQRLTF